MQMHSWIMYYMATNSVLINIFAGNINSKPFITTLLLPTADIGVPSPQNFDYTNIRRTPLFETFFWGKKARLIFDKIR